MRTCTICSRSFSKPYNLRRHYLRFHPTMPVPKLERRARGALDQTGGGYSVEDKEDMDSANDNESNDSDSDNSEQEGDVENDENWVFQNMLEETIKELGENASDRKIQRLFKRKFVDELDRINALRKHPIYKKIMKTAKDLEERDDDFDREEAIRAAIKTRSFLFERLIDDMTTIDNDKGSDDSEDDANEQPEA